MRNIMDRIKNILDKVNAKYLFGLIVIVQVMFMLLYCDMKNGYFVDEIWSYGLANSYYHAQIWEDGALDSMQISTKDLWDYIVVKDGQEFEYGSVFYNQAQDAHPPLFYVVLHTICSLFPNTFNKWFGLLPNLLYYVVAMFFLYKISKLFTQNKWFPLAVMCFWGFSISAVNMVTYIRMYMMVTMWGLMFAYFHLKTMLQEKGTWRDYLFLGISVCGGVFTHYFFVIFAFPWVILYITWLGCRKRWKESIRYILSGIIGAGIVSIMFPVIFEKILGTQEGLAGSMRNNMNKIEAWGEQIDEFTKIINHEMFGSILTLIVMGCALSVLVYVFTHVLFRMHLMREGREYQIRIERPSTSQTIRLRKCYVLGGMIGVCIGVYFLIVTNIAPYRENRYIMCIFPFIALIFVAVLYKLIMCWTKNGNKAMLGVFPLILLIGALTYYTVDPQYLYPEKADRLAQIEKYSEYSCIYVYEEPHKMLGTLFELLEFDSIYQIQPESIKDLARNLKKIDSQSEKVVLYLDSRYHDSDMGSMPVNECLKTVMEVLGYSEMKIIYTDTQNYTYLLSK